MIILKNRTELLTLIPKQGICAEVGVFRGWYSRRILRICKPKEMHLIDGWETIQHLPADTNGEVKDCNNKDFWLKVHSQVNYSFADKAIIHCGDSFDILNSFPDNYFDFLYIDANHTYEGCLSDLMTAYPKIKPKGFLAGHDLTTFYFMGVVMAVLEVVSKYKLVPIATTNEQFPSFLLQKKGIAPIFL